MARLDAGGAVERSGGAFDVAVCGIGIQVGDNNDPHINLPARPEVRWPVRVGALPLQADAAPDPS
jgi:hypothetical protein